MQENIQQLAQRAVANKKIFFGLLAGVIVLAGSAVVLKIPADRSLALLHATQGNAVISDIEVAVLGATSSIDVSAGKNSWPGELISLGSVPVQPAREGTISSWNVHIGQRVSAGEVLGTLSRPPAMPETVAMVAEKAGERAMSRTNVEAKRVYVAGRIKELTALRENTERSFTASTELLGGGGIVSGDISMIAAKKEILRSIVRGTLAKTYPIVSGGATLPSTWSRITLADPVGAQNLVLRYQFPNVVFAVKSDLDTPGRSPIESGLLYYDLMIKLADTSLPDGALLSSAMLTDLKTMLHADQQEFVMAIDEEKKAELMAVDTRKEAFEELREIDNEIAMLTQDLAMAEGDAAAKDAAYKAVEGGAFGNSVIVAPKSGTVASIMKKVGEFVGPGMPVAVVTGNTGGDLIARFRIPSNVRMPEIGTVFYATRPGFLGEMPRVKLIGVGNSLDETGSVMADALFLDAVDWPIGVSLRVIAGADTETLEIPLASVWWSADGEPNVWMVSPAGRMYAKRVTLGRTLGEKVELYGGLVRGDRYIVTPVPGIVEDMLVTDVSVDTPQDDLTEQPSHSGHEGMPGMDM